MDPGRREKNSSGLSVRGQAAVASRHEWDLYKLVVTNPAEEAWRPLAEDGCPLVKA
jgi:hypothetical protein